MALKTKLLLTFAGLLLIGGGALAEKTDLVKDSPQWFQSGFYVGDVGRNPVSSTGNKFTSFLCAPSATTSFGTVSANACAVTTTTLTGSKVLDNCTFSLSTGAPAVGLQYECYVSSANTITMQVCNVTVGGVASGNPSYIACAQSNQ